MATNRQKQNKGAAPLDDEQYTTKLDEHASALEKVRDRLNSLESVSHGDRLLSTIKKDSRIQEKMEEWIWGVLKKKAWQATAYVAIAIIGLSLANFGLEKLWGVIFK